MVGLCNWVNGCWLDHGAEEGICESEGSPSAASEMRWSVSGSKAVDRLVRTILESISCMTMFRMIFSLAIRILFGTSPGSGESQSRTIES